VIYVIIIIALMSVLCKTALFYYWLH